MESVEIECQGAVEQQRIFNSDERKIFEFNAVRAHVA
jgi:hypothetical protein